MKIHFLGTGTSSGVPLPACKCRVCTSDNKNNKRLRTSLFIETSNPYSKHPISGILIDTSPDFRYQALRSHIQHIEAVIYTHAHADHINGIDDLRSFNFASGSAIPIYANKETATELIQRFDYCFEEKSDHIGSCPKLLLNYVKEYMPFTLGSLTVMPILLEHGMQHVLGYRIDNFAYITDCSAIPQKSLDHLQGLKILVLDALRFNPHPSHFTIQQAIETTHILKPELCYFTHMSHEVEYKETQVMLSKLKSINIQLAYDCLVVNI